MTAHMEDDARQMVWKLWDLGPQPPDVDKESTEYRTFEREKARFRGPFVIERRSVTARECLERDPTRYRLFSSRKPNQGLPKGVKPGPEHEENLRRAAAERDEFEQVRRRDPAFGTSEGAYAS